MNVQIGTYGYVNSYSINSEGIYICSLTYNNPIDLVPDRDQLNASNTSPIIRRAYKTTSSTINISCIGILNTYNIISPNNPLQMLVMSNDNKYIFFPIASTKIYTNSQLITYYILCYSIIKYNIGIPLISSINQILQYVNSPSFKLTDSVYNSISNISLKYLYSVYLSGLNPPNSILSIDSNTKTWSDIAYYYYSLYNYGVAAISKDSTYNPTNPTYVLSTGILPNNLCVILDTKEVIPISSQIDCRNISIGIPNSIYLSSPNPELVSLVSSTPSLYISSKSSNNQTSSNQTSSDQIINIQNIVNSFSSFDTRINIYTGLLVILIGIFIYMNYQK